MQKTLASSTSTSYLSAQSKIHINDVLILCAATRLTPHNFLLRINIPFNNFDKIIPLLCVRSASPAHTTHYNTAITMKPIKKKSHITDTSAGKAFENDERLTLIVRNWLWLNGAYRRRFQHLILSSSNIEINCLMHTQHSTCSSGWRFDYTVQSNPFPIAQLEHIYIQEIIIIIHPS